MIQQEGYLPEGKRIGTPRNTELLASASGLSLALEQGLILEARVAMCDAGHNLFVSLDGGRKAMIPREEAALGVAEGTTRDIAIISRVGKPVCFKVTGIENGVYILSRRQAQREALAWMLANYTPGQVISARVTHLESFGAFVDIGCGFISFIGIEHISVSRILHPQERFFPRQDIFAVVTDVDKQQERISLSHRELLGTWEENSRDFEAGMTIRGVVRGVEPYGAFIELSPNLSGLAEIRDEVEVGSHVAVFVKSIIPEKMKIKLVVIDTLEPLERQHVSHADYQITQGYLSHWVYSPDCCTGKRIETVFDAAGVK